MAAFTPLILILLFVKTSSEPATFYSLPGMHGKSYSQLGDINVGALIVTSYHTAQECLQETRLTPITVEQTEAVAFAVDYVNRSPHLLPNVTFGFVIRGICRPLGPSLASALLFVPTNSRPRSDGSEQNGTARSSLDGPAAVDRDWLSHDVIGVMSPGWSNLAVAISSLYAVANLPFVAPTETGDELSLKTEHPYFFRIAPPQSFQVKATLKFIHEHGWSYISVLYTDCTFSLTTLLDNLGKYGICIATMHQVTNSIVNFEEIVSDLRAHSRARVVIAFISNSLLRKVLGAVVNQNATGHFLWIGGNQFDAYKGINSDGGFMDDPAIGSIYLDTYSKGIPEYFNHLSNINAYNTTNPWAPDVLEYLLDCSIHSGTCDPQAQIMHSGKYRTYKGTPLRVDAILTLAHAAHDLLAHRCPQARGQEARACITGPLLREYLKNVSFHGFVGPVKFDHNQDIKGRYSVKQIVYDYPSYLYSRNTKVNNKQIFGKEIGIYDIITNTFEYSESEISWAHLDTLERIIPLTPDSLKTEIPESVCSRPCLPGEYKLEKKVPCCWECRRCRDNERFTQGNTSCQACPPFTWPDPASGLTSCVDLPLTYSTLPDTIPTVITSLAVVALLLTTVLSATYASYRHRRVIKASSRELSVLQLVAIFLGYFTVLLFQTMPSHAMCGTIFVLFCMSFAMLYCPLLAKTSRIFRIFKSGTKNERPRFISPQSQLIFSASLITVQVTLCVLTFVQYSPRAQRIQPVWSEKLVELSCDLTLPGLASFLAYNIVLVSVCSVLAFLTRTLPDNFNESKFISMCVSTTLLIWLAFIPTYFTAAREFVRVFLLSVALLLNHSVALIFLFVPKIYAAVFLPDTEGHVSSKANS